MDKEKSYEVVADNVKAEVSIYQKPEDYVPRYEISFPEIKEATKTILDSIKEKLVETTGIEAREILDPKAMVEIKEKFLKKAEKLIGDELPKLSKPKQKGLAGRLIHEMLGLGRIEILIKDDKLEEIVINSSKEPVWVYHKEVGWLKTSFTLESEGKIYNYSTTIGRKVGRQISNLNPLMDAHLTTGDRVNATLFPISTQGNTITIRKFARNPWTIVHFIDPELNTLNKEIASLLWLTIQYEMNMIVAGGTASGKCVKGDSEVFVENSTEKIQSLVEKSFRKGKVEKIEDGYVLKGNPNRVKVFSLNPKSLKIEKKNVKAFWKRKSPDYVYKIKTSNKEIETTPEHPFFVLNSTIEKRRADELKEGMKIACNEGESKPVWKRVLNIRRMKSKEEWVYDLTVEPNHNFIANGIVVHNTSLLNTLTPFIPPTHRIVSIEDSVSGDSRIIYKENEEVKSTEIGKLVDSYIRKQSEELADGARVSRNPNVKILTLTQDNKVRFAKPSTLIRHKVTKPLYRIKTSTGREVKVTGDHSLFGLGGNGELKERKPKQLKEGDYLATPRRLPSIRKSQFDEINLLEHLEVFNKELVRGEGIKRLLEKHDYSFFKEFISKSNYNRWERKLIIRVDALKKALDKGFEFKKRELENLEIVPPRSTKHGRRKLPILFPLTKNLLRLVGLWLGDGSHDNYNANRIIITNTNKNCIEIVDKVCKEYGLNTSLMNDNASYSLNSTIFYKICREVLGMKGHSSEKKIPEFVYNLSNEQLKEVLKGYYSGDGSVRDYEVNTSSQSKELLKGVQTLLLRFGIISRIDDYERKDNCTEMNISSLPNVRKFKEKIGFLQKEKVKKLEKISERTCNHDNSDIIPLTQKDISRIHDNFKRLKWEYRKGRIHLGRRYLRRICPDGGGIFGEKLENLVNSDLFWDKIVEIEKLERKERYVYDISVPKTERFICDNIILHNTREIRLPDFLHWVPMTTREPNPEGKGEVSMNELMVNSLRMRPDRIIVGEIRRQKQAEVLFEAMHTGHSVYSTLHANTADEVIRRMTNPPINLPESMLEALNLTCVQFRDRRRGIRRTYQLAEIVPKPSRRGTGMTIETNILYRWKGRKDVIEKVRDSVRLMNEIEMHTDMSEREIQEDLERKQKILQWMLDNNIKTVNTVGKIMADYYRNEEEVLDIVEKDKKPKQIFGKKLLEELERLG